MSENSVIPYLFEATNRKSCTIFWVRYVPFALVKYLFKRNQKGQWKMRMFKNVDEYWFTRKATKTLFSPEISHGKWGDSWILCESIWLRCFFSPRAYPSEGKLALLKAHHAKCAMNAIGVFAHIYGNVQTKKHIFHAFLALYEFKYKVKRGLIVWMLVVRSKLQSNSQLFKIVSNI